MANYFFTESAQFKPFSYQEMLAPIKAYQDAYNALETEMNNLDILAGDIESKLTQNPKDEELRKTYNRFQTDMISAMNDLYNSGYNSSTRKKLTSLKARYSKELNPINEAYKAYQADLNAVRELQLKHPELIVKGIGNSISDYMKGNKPALTSINTNELRDEALKLAEQQSARTYREDPNWTSTAGGRALQKSTQIGLTDEEFNSAMLEIQNGVSNSELSSNAKLIKDSIDSILGTVDVDSLSNEERLKVLNSVYSGVRAGFKYKKDTKTIDDPTFAHNLALERERLKAEQSANKARKETASQIGSSTYRAVNLGKEAISKYLQSKDGASYTTSSVINEFFNSASPSAKLLSEDYMRRTNKGSFDRTAGFNSDTESSFYFQGYTPQYNMETYKEFKDMLLKAGLDPNTVTRQEVIDRFVAMQNEPDAFGRKRASIVTPDAELVQQYIERGLADNTLIEIEGFEKGGDGVLRYATKDSNIKLEDLVDDTGKLNILSLDMDYTTGERTFMIKDKEGKIREFKMPRDASFETEDANLLEANAAQLRTLEAKIASGEIIDDNRQTYVTPYGNLTASQYREKLQENADLIFASILNYMGKLNINK